MKKIFLLLLISVSLYSQESGSPYSRFGFGFFNYSVSTRSMGNAGVSIAVFDENELNNLNPASWSRIKNTAFSSGLIYESSSSEDNKATKNFSNINFSNTIIGIPIEKSKEIVFSLGIFSKSKVGYNVSQRTSVENAPADAVYFGTGGLSEFQTGLTYSPLKNLNIGIKTGYNFGEVQHSGKLNFDDENYTDNEYLNSIYIKGFTFTGGLIYSGIHEALGLKSGSIGLIVSPESNIKAKKERYSTFTKNSTVFKDTVKSGELDVTLPLNFGIGINLGLTERLTVGFDYLYSGWENYRFDGSNEGLHNSSRFAASIEFAPQKDVLASVFERMRFSAGLYYENMNLQINGERINEFGVSLGLSIPLSRNAFLNSAVVYGRRGKNENGLILDNFFKVQFSIALNELWFVKTEDQ